MEEYTMAMDWRTQYNKDISSLQIYLHIQGDLIKSSSRFCTIIDNLILKCIKNLKRKKELKQS